jgi:hypothetical protein
VFALDDVIADESEVVADKNSTSECDADGERFVVRISQTDHIGIVAVRTSQRHDAEEAHPVFRYSEVALYYLMPEVGETVRRQVDHAVMRDRYVGRTCRWGRQFA